MTARFRRRRATLAVALVLGFSVQGCKPPGKSAESPPPPAVEVPIEIVSQLADARIDAAKVKLEQKRPDEALALLVSALKATPTSQEARDLAETILRETTWNLPELTIDHRLPIDQVAFAAPSTLWVSLGGKFNTTVRWNLETLQIESVLFPAADCRTRSLTFDPQRRWVVVERGPVNLLCNAGTLKPICDLGVLPDFLMPSAVVVFSPDGLLMAHPGFVSEKDPSIVWHLRDTATGQIIRSSEPRAASAPQPIAAYQDRARLRVLHADGSVMEMPVSPVEEIRTNLPQEPAKLLAAQFSLDGNSVLTLQRPAPHQPPVRSILSYGAEDGSLETSALFNRFPWSRQPNLWSSLMDAPEQPPFSVDGSMVRILTSPHAPVMSSAPAAAVVFGGERMIFGGETGVLTTHRLLPVPVNNGGEATPQPISPASMTALTQLGEALAGCRYDDQSRTFTPLLTGERIDAFNGCDFDAVLPVFPRLDFIPTITAFKGSSRRSAEPAALLPLWDRLAHADPTRESWPALLKHSEALSQTPWHQQLTAAIVSRGENPSETETSPWLAPAKIAKIFQTNNPEAISSAIQSAGAKGPAAAAALALALKSDQPEWIQACLATARDLPPLLRQISLSRIAWLRGHKANAISGWPEVFPELTDVRLREDWDGWEQADFKPALDNIRQCVSEELAAIEVPESSTPEQRKAVADRLADPATVAAVGKRRFAEACMKAALAFSSYKEEAETTFQLANLARNMGAPPEPCLRAEALALTALGDFAQAHPRWIQLITEHPVETTVPGDYAEAAYTAFENSDPQQAMEILTTGMHRFPQDGNFAMRAGWVALLIGNSQRAYEFLLIGQRIGFPAEKLENATALLTIAAAQIGATDDAAVYFQDLLRIDPAWADPSTLDTLEWPEDLKFTLGQFTGPTIITPDP